MRQLHHGHYVLPTTTLAWTADQWATAAAAVQRDADYTAQLCQRSPVVAQALGLLGTRQRDLAERLALHPPELRADDLRHLHTACRRAGLLDQAAAVDTLFNTVPGWVSV